MAKRPMSDVIVVIPGILGSVLEKDGREIWSVSGGAALRALTSMGRSVKALALDGDDPEADDLGDGVTATRLLPDIHMVPGLWKIDGYGAITKAVRETYDVTPGENFFEFPYDWRRDNRAAARTLRRRSHEWLSSWRERSGNDDARLVLLAHSMGGLVSRAFLELEEGWRDTRALVSFGTPYRGSLNALDFIANGFRRGLGPLSLDLTDMLRSLTSVYQLLPIYPCFDPGDGALRRTAETDAIPNLDPNRATEALAFHRSIEAAIGARTDDAPSYRVHPIVGIAQPTLQSARLDGTTVRMLRTILDRDDGGDGTVPRASATPLEFAPGGDATYSASPHSSLQNTKASLVHVEGVLTADAIPKDAYRDSGGISMDVDDVYAAGEDVVIRARAPGGSSSLHAIIESTEQPGAPRRLDLAVGGDEWSVGHIRLDPGTYRVTVGSEDETGASDLVLIV